MDRAQVDPMFGWVLGELQQCVEVIGDLRHGFGIFGTEVDLEGLDRDLGLIVNTTALPDCPAYARASRRPAQSSVDFNSEQYWTG
jgi:hypothetical protein